MKFNKFRIAILIECIILLLLLPGCFRGANVTARIDKNEFRTEETDDKVEYISSEMKLLPGVYQIHVSSAIREPEQSIFIEMDCSTGTFRSLRGNGVTIFAAQDVVDFEVYVTDMLDNAYLRYSISGTEENLLQSVQVVRTNLGCRMLFFILFLIFVAVDFLVWMRKRFLEGKYNIQQLIVFCGLTGIVFCVYFPYFADYFCGGADTFFHILRIEGLKESLLNRCAWPVRIQDYWLFGHGYAVSLFYGNLFFYLPALMRIIGFPLMTAYKTFLFVIITATAGISYYSLFKMVKDRYVALFGTICYLTVPYRIFNFYNRGAIGECLAMIFIPLVCCGIYLLYTENVNSPFYKSYKWYLIIGLSVLLQSHIISTELTACFIVLTCVLFWKRTFRKETFIQLSEAAGITLTLTCWFWLPMLYMMFTENFHLKDVVSSSIQDRGTTFAEILQVLPNRGRTLESVEGVKGVYNSEPIQLGIGIIVAMLLYIAFLMYKRKKMKKEEAVFLLFSWVTLIMCMKWFPWDKLQSIPVLGGFVSSMQFPTRWLILATVFCSLFETFVFLRWKTEDKNWFQIGISFILALSIGSALYQVNDISFHSQPIYLYTAENMGSTSIMTAEYLLNSESLSVYPHGPIMEEGLEVSDYQKQGTKITVFLSNETDEERILEVPLIGYKGYAIKELSDNKNLLWVAEERGEHGDLQIKVPAGYAGKVQIWYKGFILFRIAEGISLVTLITITISAMLSYSKKKKENAYERKFDSSKGS